MLGQRVEARKLAVELFTHARFGGFHNAWKLALGLAFALGEQPAELIVTAFDQIPGKRFIDLLQIFTQPGKGDLVGQVGAGLVEQYAHRGGRQKAVQVQPFGRRALGAKHQFGH